MTTALSAEHDPSFSSTASLPTTGTTTTRPTFERAADETMERTRGIYAERGASYADTWAMENQTFAVMRATLRRFGVELSEKQMRLLKLAALIDTKDDRLIGKWNPDSIDDGLAYRACWATLRDEWERGEMVAVRPRIPLDP